MEGTPYPLKKQNECPRCGGPMIDMRGLVFNHDAVAAEGTCFRWSEGDFRCCSRDGLGKRPAIQEPGTQKR